MVAPAQHVRGVAGALAQHLPAGKPVVLCAKGLEQATGKLLGEVLAETMPQATQAVLSGPSFAADVARGLPAALTLATADEALGEALATALGYRGLRIYWSSDTDRRAAGRRGEERAGDRRRHRRRQGPGRQRARGPRHARLRRAAPLRRGAGRAARDADGPVGPRRPAAHLRQPAVAQHEPGARAGPGPDAGRRARQPALGGGGRLYRRGRRQGGAREGRRHADLPGRARHRRGQAHRRRRHRGAAVAAAAGGGGRSRSGRASADRRRRVEPALGLASTQPTLLTETPAGPRAPPRASRGPGALPGWPRARPPAASCA